MSAKIKIEGPCRIIELTDAIAKLENLITKTITRQHITHIHEFKYDNKTPLPQNWESAFLSEVNNAPTRRSARRSEQDH